MGLFQYPLLLGLVVAEVIQGQRSWALVDVGEGVLDAAVRHDRQQRAEDFVLHDAHVVVHVEQQVRLHGTALARLLGVQVDDLGAFAAGIGEVTVKSGQVALIDDGGVVAIVGQAWVKVAHGLAIGLDKTFDAVLGYQDVVRGHAGLASVEVLAESDAFGGILERYIGRHDGRRFASQLQGDRGQVLGGGTHHMPANTGSAGEQQMVERQLRERHADIGFTQHHRYQILWIDAFEQGLEQLTSGRRRFAEFEHDPVARGQGAGQRADGQEQRVVPRHDDPDHAQGLVDHLGRRRLEG
ncbi:hypothetical protein D3C76_1089750 [compost metagenome]